MLTDIERRFRDALFEGLDRGKAYMKAGYKVKDESVAKAAASRKLKAKPEILASLEELRNEELDEIKLTKHKKRVLLAEIAQGKAIKSEGYLFAVSPTHRERIAAIAEDSRLAGDYEATEAHVSVEGDLFGGLLELVKGDEGCIKTPSGVCDLAEESDVEA